MWPLQLAKKIVFYANMYSWTACGTRIIKVADNGIESGISHTNTNNYVDSYLDFIDCSMLRLNVQACSEIISNLREEEYLVASSRDSRREPKTYRLFLLP